MFIIIICITFVINDFQDAYNQASVAMATTQASIAMDTSQASAQSHGVYAATLTQGQWYHQPYQHYYQNFVGDYMKQQKRCNFKVLIPKIKYSMCRCDQQFIMLLKLNTLRCNLNHRSNLGV